MWRVAILHFSLYLESMSKITSDPHILGGKPVIRGTRISVELVLSLVASGMTIDGILENYPHLKRSDVKAAIEYGSKLAGGFRAGTPKTVSASAKK